MNSNLNVDTQTPWECRWTKLARPAGGHHTRRPQEIIWVCVRAGDRRYVSEAECETCEHWEPHASD